MNDHEYSVKKLSEKHQIALNWLEHNVGREEERFPDRLPNGQLLATRAKGIYKPEGWTYALSVRVTLNSPYKDGEFYELDNGGWIISYHQEVDPRAGISPETLFTNLSLLACLRDRVPIGVYQQLPAANSGGTKYLHRGLGGVIDKIGSHFIIADVYSASNRQRDDLLDELLRREAETRTKSSDEKLSARTREDGESLYSTKLRVWTEIVRRQGQGKFREKVLAAYSGRCCISGTSSSWVLDAAHIEPYGGPDTNLVTNGLLLRTDLHTLFDMSLLGIEPLALTVRISPLVKEAQYQLLDGTPIQLPSSRLDHPEISRLKWRWDQFRSSASI
jgi:putative restriction endonuclease